MPRIYRIIASDDGWAHTVITQAVRPGTEFVPPSGEVILETKPSVEPPLLYLSGGTLSTPHSNEVARVRLRRAGYDEATSAAIAQARDVGALPDLPVGVALAVVTRGLG